MRHLTWMLVATLYSTSARADGEVSALDAGVAAYEALEYQRAVDLLQQAYGEPLTREQKLKVLETLAFAHSALDQPEQARAELRLLLRLEPKVQLDPGVSPRVHLLFEEVRSELPELPQPSPAPLLSQPSPPPRAKRPLYKQGWVWGTATGATLTIIIIGAIAGVLAAPPPHVTIAHP